MKLNNRTGTSLLLGCLVMIATATLYAEAPTTAEVELNRDRFPEALGFRFRDISGMGLSYHRWMGSTGFEIAGGILYFPLAVQADFPIVLDYSIGLQVNRSVFASDYSDRVSGQLYLVAGISHRGEIEREFTTGGSGQETAGPFVPSIGVGGGLGIEIVLFDHFSFPIEVLYAPIWSYTGEPFLESVRITLAAQTGFRYRF